MFDDLLSSSEEDEDIIIEQCSLSCKSRVPRSTSPRSLHQATKDLLDNLESENCEMVNTPDVPASETSEERSNLNPIILSFIIFDNHLGAAYYNFDTGEIFIMDDICSTTFNISIISTLYKQCLPMQIITVKGVSPTVVKQLGETIATSTPSPSRNSVSQSSESIISVNTELKVLAKNEYSSSICISRVKILKLESEPTDFNMSERLLYLNSFINFKSQSMVYALGLLLNYIDKHWNVIEVNIGQPKFLSINHISIKDIVMLNEEAYEALDILRVSQHPSFFKFGNLSGQTAVSSLYALFNQCQSKPGSQRLWQILHYPSKDINLIKMRLNVIEFFFQPNNQFIADNLQSCMKHIHNITPNILNKSTAPNCKSVEWRKFYETIYHIILIEDICRKYQQHLQLFEKLAQSDTEELHFIKYFIEYILDFDESKRSNRVVVKHGVDTILDNLREIREGLPELLSKVVTEDLENLPPEIENCRMLYYPDICFVLCVTKWKTEPPEDFKFPDMEYKFTISNCRHYKTKKALELDETIGDLQMKIQKRQSQIMNRLTNYITQHSAIILNAFRQCVDLDVLLSFYIVAQNHNYVKPEIVQDQVIEMKNSRHPLYELNSPNYVSNDIHSGNSKSVVKILTGPNACGKSVYLKQIALNVFMAHLGSYVPAESATIGVVDHILTQISSSESCAFDASAFVQDLRQVNTIVNSATRNSLVIIDEFGKSTSEIDGLAIASSVLKDLIDRKSECPHVFASTHMHKILNLLPRNEMVELQTFEYVIHDDQSIVFLYRLIDGSVSSSYAHSVAKLCGLDKSFIDEAKEVYDKVKNNDVPTEMNKEGKKKQCLMREFILRILNTDSTPSVEEVSEVLKSIRFNANSSSAK